MSGIPGWLLRHQITIEPLMGTSAYGPVYGPPVVARCFLDQQTRQVRDPMGEQVVSSSTAYCPLNTVAPAQSRVVLPGGATAIVIAALRRDGTGLGTPDHLELQLT